MSRRNARRKTSAKNRGPRVAKVRIALLITPDGNWAASGSRGQRDVDMLSDACGTLDSGLSCQTVWIEAEVPLDPQRVYVAAPKVSK